MAKRQRNLLDMYTKVNSNTSNVKISDSPISHDSHGSSNQLNVIQKENLEWKDVWFDLYDWVHFDRELGRVFCKTCKEGGGKYVYATDGSANIKISGLQDHTKSREHKKLTWAKFGGKQTLKKQVTSINRLCNEAMMCLFRAAYFIGKEGLSFHKFPSLCVLLLTCKAFLPEKLYHDEKACSEMVFAISCVITNNILDRVRDYHFFGLMIDESTDISVTWHLVVFVTFIEGSLPITCFLGLLCIEGGRKDSMKIFETLMIAVKTWGLDITRCVGFGSDGASTMVGRNNGVATLLKKESPFMTSTHCIAHRTNLAALEASKNPSCKEFSVEIDTLINDLASFFKKSCKRKCVLQTLQKELNDAQKTLKRYHKIRWLSRWESITTLCDSLESVCVFFRDGRGDASDANMFEKLRDFKFIYVLYFLANILSMLAKLSKIFQQKVVDISSIGSIVKSEIATIRMCFVMNSCDLNQDTFNSSSGFPILPQFGPPCGYLQRLSSEIRGSQFHSIDLIRDPLGRDLESALDFQKTYSEAVCSALEARFVDNDIIDCFKILNPLHMPRRQVGLASWGVVELDRLLQQYGVQKTQGVQILPPLVNATLCKQEFFAFKIQGSTKWMDLTFVDVWTSISWSPSLKVKYSNLLILAEIAKCQCVSTATCERAFSVQNTIKQKLRNRMSTSNLESMMRVAIEGPDNDFDDILTSALDLWKDDAKFRHLYSNPERYLSGASYVALEEVP